MDMVPMPNVTLQGPAIGSIGYWRRPRQRVVANDVVILDREFGPFRTGASTSQAFP